MVPFLEGGHARGGKTPPDYVMAGGVREGHPVQ